jgi:hypothetical protein
VTVESSIRTQIDPVQIKAGQMKVEYIGPLAGPSSVNIGANPSRGTSTVEAGSYNSVGSAAGP